VKSAYLVSHPIQYQAPLLSGYRKNPISNWTFFSAQNFRFANDVDKGFGVM